MISRWSARPIHTYWDYVRLRFPRREGRDRMNHQWALGSGIGRYLH